MSAGLQHAIDMDERFNRYDLTIEVPENFEGTLDHWQDCYFAFPSDYRRCDKLEAVLAFCERMEWDVSITYKRS